MVKRTKLRLNAAAPAEKALGTKKPMRPARCRRFMQERLAEAFPEIVQGFVESAKGGSCAHVKLAAELLALEKVPTRRKGSAARMLESLGRSRDTGRV